MAGTLPGFDPDAFRAGLHTAAEFFVSDDHRPLFHFPSTASGAVDRDNVPWDPSATVALTPAKPPVSVPCSIRYRAAGDELTNFGVVVQSELIIGLLDVDYAKVEGFDYVVINGNRYFHRSTDPPAALGTVAIWTCRCIVEDEG